MAIRKSTKKGAKKGTKKTAKRARPGANVTVSLPRPLYKFLDHLRSILITQTQGGVELNEPMVQALCDALGGAEAAALRRELERAFVSIRAQIVNVEGIIP